MFRYHSVLYGRILFAADLLSGLAALIAAYLLRSLVKFLPLELAQHFNPVLLPLLQYLYFFLVCLPIWSALLLVTQQYSDVLRWPFRRQVGRVAQFLMLVGMCMAFLTYTLKLEVSRPIFFAFLLLTGILLSLNRAALDGILRSRNISEHNQIHILVVGAEEKARGLITSLEALRHWGFNVVGFLSDRDGDESTSARVHRLGSPQQLRILVSEGLVVDEIIFADSGIADLKGFQEIIAVCQELGIRTRVAADFFPPNSGRVSLEYLDGIPFITLLTVPEHSFDVVLKRIVDFLVAAGCLILWSPLLLLIGMAVKLTSRGPVFYRQTRCGLFGRRFTLVKFRTMIDGAEDKLWEIRHLNEMSGPVFKMRNDPRVTPLGKYLRKFSLDEIPQFWNVIKGEMSVVGPRAPLSEEVEFYSFRQRRRLSVKPGITCLWQVSGRSEIDFQRWMDLDLQYIDNWSLWLDLSIMLKTIPAVFSGRGAR